MTRVIGTIGLVLAMAGSVWGEDEIEFLSGAKVKGTVKEIRKDKQEFDFEVQLGGRAMLRTYPYAKVHSVTINGTKHVLTAPGSNDNGGSRGKSSRACGTFRLATGGTLRPEASTLHALGTPECMDRLWTGVSAVLQGANHMGPTGRQ